MRPILACLPLLLLSGLALAAPPQHGPNRLAQGFTHNQQLQQRMRLQQPTFSPLQAGQLGRGKKSTDALTGQLQRHRRQMQGAYYLQQQAGRPTALATSAEPQIRLQAPRVQPPALAAEQTSPGVLRRAVSRLRGLFH